MILSLTLCSSFSFAQITEGFETGLPASAPSTATECTLSSGIWTILKGAQSGTKHGGSYALSLSSGSSTPAYASTPSLNTAGTMTLWTRGGGATTLTILKSVNGGTFTSFVTQAITSAYAQYTIPINDTEGDVRLRIQNGQSTTIYIDDVSITTLSNSFITVSAASIPDFKTVVAGNSSAVQTYTVSGLKLTSPLAIKAPAGFKVSSDNTTFTDSLSLAAAADGSVAVTTIYVNFSPTDAMGTITGKIANTSNGASAKQVSVTGTSIASEPTISGSVSFGEIQGKSIVVNFSGGNGNKRIVAANADNVLPVTYLPTDGVTETGVNNNFSTAVDKGAGQKVVYDGSDTTVTVTGIASGTTYHFAVYEYNVGSSNSQNYLTTSAALGNATTLTVPGLAASSSALSFGSVLIDSLSAEKTYSLSGSYLNPADGVISLSVSDPFLISTTSGMGYASALSLPYSGGTLAPTTVYVHFKATAETSYTGSIMHTGGGADPLVVTLSGKGSLGNPDPGHYDIVVAKDGSGDFTTVQDALKSIPLNNKIWKTVFIKNGLYFERDSLTKTQDKVVIIGENKDSTIIQYNSYSGMTLGGVTLATSTCQVLYINSSDVILKNLTVQNTYTSSQAVALNVHGDRIIVDNCKLIGYQDTYYTWGYGRFYTKNSYIEGATDFIFGRGAAIFDSCEIHSISKSSSTVTAPSTDTLWKFGYVFRNCSLTAGSGVKSIDLGRP